MKNFTFSTQKCFFIGKLLNLRLLSLVLVIIGMSGNVWGQSFRTPTFTGNISDFNAAERFAAAANNTTYAITFDATNLYIAAFRTSGVFGGTDNFTIYIDTDPRNTLNSGNGTTSGRAYNNVTPTLPFNADYALSVEQSYTDPLQNFNGTAWASTSFTPTVTTNSTSREITIPLSRLGNPASVYITCWMGYNGGTFSNAPGTDLAASGTPTITGFFGSFPIYKSGITPVSFRTQNTTTASGGGTAISNLSLSAGTTLTAGDYGDITLSGAITYALTGNTSFTGTMTYGSGTTNSTRTDLAGYTLYVGGRGIGGTAGRITLSGSSTTHINAAAGTGSVVFLGGGDVSAGASTGSIALVPAATTFEIGGAVNLGSTGATPKPLVNGTLKINSGGSLITNTPVYGNASTLIYNTGGTYGRGIEWSATGAGTIGTTAGYPNNVQISNNTTLDLGNGGTGTARACAAALTIDAGSTLTMASNAMTQPLTVGTNITINGTLTLSGSSGGDINVKGNWTRGSLGVFNANNRAVFFNGSGTQVIAVTGGGTQSFPFLLTSGAGYIQLSSSPATDVTVTGSSGLSLANTNSSFSIDLNGRTLTVSGGGNLASGESTVNKRIFSSSGTGTFAVTTSGLTLTRTASERFLFGNNVIVDLTTSMNFGTLITGNAASVIGQGTSGILRISSGGSVLTNAPSFAAGSTLQYNSGANPYNRGAEWTATSAGTVPVSTAWSGTAGYPANVQVSNNTTLNYPNGTGMTARVISGNLTIDAGSSLYMDYGSPSPGTSGSLSVVDLTMNGNLSLGNAVGGDLIVRGNWIKGAGTFNPNTRAVSFSGTTAQTLTGATTFDFLTLNNSTGLTLQSSSAVTVNSTLDLTAGRLTLGVNDLTIGSSGSISNSTSTKYIVTNSTGQLRRTIGTSVLFPVGASASSYNPVTITNSGTTDVYGIRATSGTVSNAQTTALTVNNTWVVTESVSGGSTLNVLPSWLTADQGASFASGTTTYIGFYNGSTWTQNTATISGSGTGASPFVATAASNFSPSNLTTGTQYFAVGKDNAFACNVISNASSVSASSAGGYSASVTWTNPTNCFDEIMIVASTSSNTGTPTGNGSSYTSSLTYSSGTALGNGFVVYKGTSSPQTITGLANGTLYYFKVYSRFGSTWSSGTEVTATPAFCAPTYSSGNSSDYISLVSITGTTLNNSTSNNAQAWTVFSQSGSTTATLNAGGNYTLNVAGGSYSIASAAAWIDYNGDGVFSTTEYLGTFTGIGSSTTKSLSFSVPTIASGNAVLGTIRLRVRQHATSSAPTSGQPCGATSSSFGEAEDYNLTLENAIIPTITLGSNNIASGSIQQNSNNSVIYSFSISASSANATLTGLSITTTGTYSNTDITNLKCYYQSSTTFNAGTASLLSTLSSPGTAGSKTFSSLTEQTINNGTTGYIFITADVPCSSTSGNTISISAVTGSNTSFSLGTATGTPSAGNTQTISTLTPSNATSIAASTTSQSTVVTWTNPSCFSEVMIVVSPAANNGGTPSGNGSAYTANLAYGSGTAFGNGFVVYKGSTSSQTITNLTNGTTYYIKVFSRNGTSWSAGSEITVTPNITYCTYTNTNSSSYFINSFSTTGGFTNITNNSSGFSNSGYGYFNSTSVTTILGVPVNFSITSGNGSMNYGIWIDWNEDGDFLDPNENPHLTSSMNNTSSGTINVPSGTSLGTKRMRVTCEWMSGSAVSCGGSSYGECEDYNFIVSSSTLNPATLSSALSTTYGTASSGVSFTASGTNLTANITATAQTGYEVSTSSGSGYGSSVTVASGTAVWVRLASTQAVASYNNATAVVLSSTGATNVNVTTSASGNTVTQKALTITGLTANNKVYDATTSVSITGTAAYSGLVNGESFSVSGAPTWAFATKTAGTAKAITQTGSFSAPSANYSITQPTFTADITVATLTITGATASNKVYDGTTTATISGGSLSGVLLTDVVTLTQSGTFASANVANGISVTSTSSISGTDAGNYTLTQPSGLTANITQATQTIVFGALANKITTDAPFACGATSVTSGVNPLTYSSSNTAVATINSSGVITIVGAGTTTITVSQAGNTNYSAAADVAQSLTVNQVCLSENFNVNSLPSGWSQTGITFTTNYAEFIGNTGDLTTLALTNPGSLNFTLSRTTNSTAKTFYVEVSTTSQTSGFTIIDTYTHSNTTSGGTTNCTTDLSSYSANSSVWIRFRKDAATTSPWRLDNISVNCANVPEINVKQASTSITSGSGSYSFGTITTGNSSSAITFTVENNGNQALNLSGTPKIAISGTNSSDFTIDQTSTSSSVAAGANTIFTITFSPSAAGSRTATISIANNDSDENPYTFSVSGIGNLPTAPEINVKQSSTDIASGGGYAFGSVLASSSSSAITFTIENTGNSDLNLTATPKIAISGTNAAEFSINQSATATPIAQSSSTTFTVTFSPTSTGAKSATITISNDDVDEGTYTLLLSGTGTMATQPTNQPTGFTLTAVATTTMSIGWTAATGSPDGYLVLRTTASGASYPNTDPVDGTAYTVGNTLGNATVEYIGTNLSAAISSLAAGSQYSYEIYSYNGSGNSINYLVTSPLQGQSYTLSTEPNAHAASFTATATSATNINLAFSASSTLPSTGYLLLKKSSPFVSGDYPVDGNAYGVGTAVGSNGATVNTIVTSNSTTSSTGTGVAADNTFYYLLVPYNGSIGGTRNYYTGGTIPTATATTPSANSDAIVVSSSESATISSLMNDATPLTSSTGVQVWQFTIRDGGSGLNDNDALPTKISSIALSENVSSNVSSWNASIKSVALFDGSTLVASGTVGNPTNNITFSGLSLSIPDGQSKTLSLRLSLNNTLGATDDGKKFVFNLTNTNLTAVSDGTSSGVASFTSINSSTTANIISVVATKLAFVQQPPSSVNISAAMSPAVTVDAEDANGNRDLDYVISVSIVSTGTLSSSPQAATPSAGLATFSNITHTAVATGRQLTATSGSLTSAVSNTFDVILAPVTIYQHNFGATTISGKPYSVTPTSIDANLSASSWTTSESGFIQLAGNTGNALSLSAVTSSATYTLTFDVAAGYELSIASFDFWRQRSSTGPANWSMTINGTNVGSGTTPTTGASIGSTNVSNTISGLTGTVPVVLSLTSASGGTFRLDDFTLYGNVTCLTPSDRTVAAVSSTVCNGLSTNISVSTSQLGVNYQLRNNSDNSNIGSPVSGTGGTINLSTGNLTSATTFNVLATSTCGLTQTMSVTPTVIINSNPSAPTGSAAQTLCSGATVAELSATGTAVQWYAASSGGSVLSSSTALVNSTTYHATQTVNGCESTSRLAVTATLNSIGTWIGGTSTDWSNSANWCGGVPTSSTNVTIPSGTANSAVISSNVSLNSLTISSGATLSTSGTPTITISNNGSFTNNGTFTAGSSKVSFAGNGTVSGTVSFNDVDIAGGVNFGTSSTVNGTLSMNAGSYINTNAPIYGTGSTLKYNTGGPSAYGRSLEWSATSGAGAPHSVQISNSTTLNYPNTGNGGANAFSTNLSLVGNLTVDNGSALYMDWGGNANKSGRLDISGNVLLNGNLSLGNASGGDIKVGGNWTRNSGSTLNTNNRAIFFTGSGTSTITGNGGETFTYMVNEKTGGSIQLGSNLTLTAPNGGNALTHKSTASLDLNGNDLTFSGPDNSTILADGACSITGTGNVLITSNTKNLTGQNSGSWTFGSNVNLKLQSGVNFGTNLSTVNGTLEISSGGFVSGDGRPSYGVGSTLKYNSTGTYGRSKEWLSGFSSGAGVPYNVLISAGTTLDPGANSNFSIESWVRNDLSVDGTFDMSLTDQVEPINVLGSVIFNGGTLKLSTTLGGDIKVGGNWSGATGTFVSNSRAVYFNGTGNQTISRNDNFPYLFINKTSGTLTISGSITLNNKLSYTDGGITISGGSIDASGASAEVEFANSSSYTLPAGLFSGNINKLTLTGAGGITLTDNTTVTGTLKLTNGKITLGSKNLTLTGSLDGTDNGSVNSYVNTNGSGALIRSIASTGVDYKFPVGLSNYSPISVNFTGGTISSSTLASRAVSGLHPNATDGAYIRTNLYWEMNQTGMTNPQYNVSFTYPGVTNGTGSNETESNLLPAKWSASTGWLSSGSCSVCFNGTTMGTSSINTATKTITWNGVTGFSDFGGFGQGNGSPLPVELTSFNASCEDEGVVLNWSTASEQNSSHFDIEKSENGTDWRMIESVQAAGNSTHEIKYTFVDSEKTNGQNYYRLNQVDIDGKNEYFGPITVSCEEDLKINTYPNPSKGEFNLVMYAKTNEQITLKITDGNSKVLSTKVLGLQNGINLFPIRENLSAGVYHIQLITESGKITVLKHTVY